MLYVGFITAVVSGTLLSFSATLSFKTSLFIGLLKWSKILSEKSYHIIFHVKGVSLPNPETIASKASHIRAQLAILVLVGVFIADGLTPL